MKRHFKLVTRSMNLPSRGGQKMNLASLWELGDARVRVTITIDLHYDYQSRCGAEYWNGSEWVNVSSLFSYEKDFKASGIHEARLKACEKVLVDRAAWALGIERGQG